MSCTFSEALVIKAGIFLVSVGSFNVIQDMSPTYISWVRKQSQKKKSGLQF